MGKIGWFSLIGGPLELKYRYYSELNNCLGPIFKVLYVSILYLTPFCLDKEYYSPRLQFSVAFSQLSEVVDIDGDVKLVSVNLELS